MNETNDPLCRMTRPPRMPRQTQHPADTRPASAAWGDALRQAAVRPRGTAPGHAAFPAAFASTAIRPHARRARPSTIAAASQRRSLHALFGIAARVAVATFAAALVATAFPVMSACEDARASSPEARDDQAGAPSALAQRLAGSPIDACARVEPLLQGEAYPSGCEPASLACALRATGIPASIEGVIACLDIDEGFSDFVHRYAGDPAGQGSAWPPAMVDAANRYLDKAGRGDVRAFDISGIPFSEAMTLIEAGYPVIMWTTVDMETPEFTDMVASGQRFVRNNHCVVAYGHPGEGSVAVMDPMVGSIRRDEQTFSAIYEARGRLAMVLAPTA